MKININGVTRDMTAEEEAEYNFSATPEMRIAELKHLLTDTDYKAIKYAEGFITEADYAATKVQRQAWRDEINQLEGKNQ